MGVKGILKPSNIIYSQLRVKSVRQVKLEYTKPILIDN